jgi:class 3 adenylate cyclase/tetratricopeptide (TPR) repeat protein
LKCPRCQHDNPQGARFCEECATPLARTCSNCGTALSATAKFCHACAHPVAGKGGAPSRSPDSYTPKHLAEKILTSKAALEGERKQVTVLFADLKGSMELLSDRDPEEARKLLDPVLEGMMEAVHRYEGTVNQVMGDGIMALFGAPIAHEDHAVRACYAALRMQETVGRHAEEVARREGIRPQIRVGINSGEVVVRSVGSDLRMDYTAVGQTTHMAARMEQIASPGAIVTTRNTRALAEGYIDAKPLGLVPVKGLADPVDAFEVTGAGPARSRLQVGAGRGLTRFVGRDADLDQLRRLQELAGSGHGQVAAIIADAGVGKSRLVYEFIHSPACQNWLVVEGISVSYGQAMTYVPVVDLLRGFFKIDDRDDHRQVHEKVVGRLLGLDPSLEPEVPPLLALLNVPVDDNRWAALDPPTRRQRTLDAVKRLLVRESQAQPLAVVVEDLHWIDTETQAVLDTLIESVTAARILLLVTYRPEYEHPWGKKTYYTQLRLVTLPPERASELLTVLLGDGADLDPLKQMLRRRGNPFFVEETVRTLVEIRALEGERGAYRLMRPVESLQIPATVHAILAARIDRLSADDKQLMQVASVIGQDVPFRILAAIADLSDEALRRGLRHLQEAEFLYETALFPDLEYRFKHALTHEVAYGSLVHDRRRRLHTRVTEAIESLYPSRLSDHVDELAHHAFKGEAWDKAVRYLREAAAKAFGRSANRQAITYAEEALRALSNLPETRETLEQGIDVRCGLRASLWTVGETARIRSVLDEAAQLARRCADQQRLGLVSVLLSHYFWVTAQLSEARKFATNALQIGTVRGDRELQIGANYYLGTTSLSAGRYMEANSYFVKVIDALPEGLIHARCGLATFPAPSSRAWFTWSLAERGAFEEGIVVGREGIRIAETLGHAYSLSQSWWALGMLYAVRGDVVNAGDLVTRSLALARERNVVPMVPLALWTLGQIHVLSGRVSEGMVLVQQALDTLKATGAPLFQPVVEIYLGGALLRAHRHDDALGCARAGLAVARERGQRGFEGWALGLLGDIASDSAVTAESPVGHYREAMRLADELAMRPLVAHCHAGLGKLCRRTNKPEQAQEHLTTAMTMYRGMGMTYWLEKAEAEATNPAG